VIPQVLLSARPKSEVGIVSPWLADVTFDAPILEHLTPSPTLSWLLNHLVVQEVSLVLVVREREGRFNRLWRKLAPETRSHIRIIQVDHIHTKAILTERLVIKSSANLLETSLHRNRENVSLEENRYGSVRRWLEFEQDVR